MYNSFDSVVGKFLRAVSKYLMKGTEGRKKGTGACCQGAEQAETLIHVMPTFRVGSGSQSNLSGNARMHMLRVVWPRGF